MTATELKKRAIALAEKTKIDSVTPEEFGQLSNDIVEYIENVEINGSSLGIRKTYTSVSAMEADSTAPKDDKGVLLRRGMLVNIYNQEDPDSADNGKVFSFQNPGWAFRGTVDAGYATKEELTKLDERTKDIEKKVGYTQRQLVWSKQLTGTIDGVPIDYNFEMGETYVFSATKIKSGDVSFSQFSIRFNRGTYTVVINDGSALISGTNFDYLNGKYEVEYTRNEEHPIELGGSGPAFANALIDVYKLVKIEGIYENVQELLPLKDEKLNYDTTEYNSVNKSDFKEQNETIYSTDGNTSTGENGYCSSEFIDIEENAFAITIWKILRPIGAIPPIVFFDENNDFISAVPFGRNKYVEIPSQTKKYKWQNRSTDAGCILYSWHYRVKQILIDSVKSNLIRLSNIQSLYNPFLLLSNLRILCIGDSLTEGDHGKIEDGAVMNVKHTNYPFYLSKILNNLNITNAGKCGYKAKSWYNGEFSKYTYTNYDVVIILMGINGGLTDEHIDDGGDVEKYPLDNTAGYTAYYCKLIEELIKSNNKLQIILCSYPHVQSINLEGTRITIPKIAYRYGCTHIDLSEIGVSVFTPNYLNNIDK